MILSRVSIQRPVLASMMSLALVLFGFISMVGLYDSLSVFSFAVGPVVAAGIGAASTLWARRLHQRGLRDAREVARGVLDRLEAGHPHGMVKDTLVTNDE